MMEAATRAVGCHRVLPLRGQDRRQIREHSGILLAQFVDAEPASHGASILRLSEQEFEHGTIVCQTMAGALIFENESGTRRDAVVDGLRFADAIPDPKTGLARVRVRGDMRALDPKYLSDVLPCMSAAMGNAAVTLAYTGANRESRAAAASFAAWLAQQLPAYSDELEVKWLRVFALYLSRVEAALPIGRADLDVATHTRIRDHLSEISLIAIEADERIRDFDVRLWPRSQSSQHQSSTSSRVEEADALEQLRRLRRSVSERYSALLAELHPIHDLTIQRADRAHQTSAVILHKAVSEFVTALGQAELSPAGRAILEAIASAPLQQPAPVVDEQLLSRHGEETTNVTFEFIRREACVRASAVRLLAFEAMCQTLAAGESAERGLTGLEQVEVGESESASLGVEVLRTTLTDGFELAADVERPLDDLLVAWEEFDVSRRELLAARSAGCRVSMETWYHSVLEISSVGSTANARHEFQLEHYRLLTALGHALRRQQAALDNALLVSPTHLDSFELGPVGHLISLQVGLLSDQARRPGNLESNRRHT